MGSVPNSARTSSATRTSAGPSIARMRRNTTAVCGSPGNASDSRHSTMPSEVTHRERQIIVRGSYRPPQTKRECCGVTAYTPPPPSSELKTAGLSQRGRHIQHRSPRGPSTIPRSPSASRLYCRSTCGGNCWASAGMSIDVFRSRGAYPVSLGVVTRHGHASERTDCHRVRGGAAYSIPTDAPESDGTLAWESTTLVVVSVRGRSCRDRLHLWRQRGHDRRALEAERLT